MKSENPHYSPFLFCPFKRGKMQHYKLLPDDSFRTGQSFTIPDDTDNELVSFTAGWLDLSKGFYVQVSKRDLCVVEFGTTKRSALRYARRAWRKEWDKRSPSSRKSYPKVINCED